MDGRFQAQAGRPALGVEARADGAAPGVQVRRPAPHVEGCAVQAARAGAALEQVVGGADVERLRGQRRAERGDGECGNGQRGQRGETRRQRADEPHGPGWVERHEVSGRG